jgi:2-amino-4-hydroxy-6-hydroxymethyldihydropteridine diphosphokinase
VARAFVALGSNLQQPSSQVRRALVELSALPDTSLVRHSALYRSTPVGYDHQPDFINAVAEVDTSLQPLELLKTLFALENLHGRERPFPNAPRVLDLDLLLYDDTVMNTAELTLPHPRMLERGFVLVPLAEIAPELVLQGTAQTSATAAVLAAKFSSQDVGRLNG